MEHDALLLKVLTEYPDAVGAEVTRFVMRYDGQDPSFGYSAKLTMPRLGKDNRKLSGSTDWGGVAETPEEAMEKAKQFYRWKLEGKI